MQREAGSRPEPSMNRCRAPTAVQDHGDADDSDELGVFTAERYFYGDDAPWCERSWSSLSSSAFRTGTIENDRSVPTPTAATGSSEASWNSRSALLPNEPDEKWCAAGASPIVEAVPSREETGRTDRRPGSSSNLRRWLLGAAGCACAGGSVAEESVSSDGRDASNGVPGISGHKCNTEASALSANTEDQGGSAARVSSGSGRWLLGGKEALSPIELVGHGYRRRATNPGELPSPIFHPEATATSNERRRVNSLQMFRPAVGDQGSAFEPATQKSAVTVIAGNKALGGAPRAASGSGGSPGDPRLQCGSQRDSGEDDDAAWSEIGCAYPPSEASVVWSVVTADGAASGNFSSAASGYYYHCYFSNVEDRALRHAAAKSSQKRRSGMASGSSLLTCMSEKAVDAVGPARSIHRQDVEPPAVALAKLRAAGGGSRNGHGGGHHMMRRR
ncbi:hypothetical protein BS78_09G087900 [Paspalum vaginatum]|nr:hypothetical protein BS78_09G087900 [Paspalum vaginatum]